MEPGGATTATLGSQALTPEGNWQQKNRLGRQLHLQRGLLDAVGEPGAERRSTLSSLGDKVVKQLIVPQKVETQQLDCSPTAGQLGVNNTLGRIREVLLAAKLSQPSAKPANSR